MKERREFMKKVVIGATAAMSTKIMGQSCDSILTPTQTEGPFYPDYDIIESDSDLVFMKGKKHRARGEIVIINGIVQDQYCRPVIGAIVELWQACDTGKYNHASDPNPAKLDPNFQYYAKVRTDDLGRFKVRTIIPGSYPATTGWDRPPHIHFKFSLRGYSELTTQTYFKGHPLNEKDRILQSLSKRERESVIIDFKKRKNQKKDDSKHGNLIVTLNKY